MADGDRPKDQTRPEKKMVVRGGEEVEKAAIPAPGEELRVGEIEDKAEFSRLIECLVRDAIIQNEIDETAA